MGMFCFGYFRYIEIEMSEICLKKIYISDRISSHPCADEIGFL